MKSFLIAGFNIEQMNIGLNRCLNEVIQRDTRSQRIKVAQTGGHILESRILLPQNWTNFLSLNENRAALWHYIPEICFLRHLMTRKWQLQ